MSQYDRYRTIVNVEPRTLYVDKFYKTGNFIITKNKKYGYAWMQNAVFWLAKKLGMLRNEKDSFTSPVYIKDRIDLKDKNLERKIMSVIRPFLQDGFTMDELVLVTGKEFFQGLVANQREHMLNYPIHMGYKDSTPRLFGIKILITDYIEGFVVLPIKQLKG